MRMQVILDSSFARPGSAPIWGGKKGEFRDWTRGNLKKKITNFEVLYFRQFATDSCRILHIYPIRHDKSSGEVCLFVFESKHRKIMIMTSPKRSIVLAKA